MLGCYFHKMFDITSWALRPVSPVLLAQELPCPELLVLLPVPPVLVPGPVPPLGAPQASLALLPSCMRL